MDYWHVVNSRSYFRLGVFSGDRKLIFLFRFHDQSAVGTMVLAGICSCAIYFLRSASQNLIVACLFSTFMATGNMVLSSVVVDIFPTHVSAMAICLAILSGRIGAIVSNLLFGLLLDINCKVPIFLVGGVVVCEYNYLISIEKYSILKRFSQPPYHF